MAATKTVQESYRIPVAELKAAFFPDSGASADGGLASVSFDGSTKEIIISFRPFQVELDVMIPKIEVAEEEEAEPIVP